jgi:hypothetical protein
MSLLDPDLIAKLRATARTRQVSFKAALNDAVRAGLATTTPPSKRFTVHAQPLGIRPGIDADKALHIATEMEDAEILRKHDPLQA